MPVSAWAVSQTPEKMAEEVAPRGFKVHYDLNFDSTVEHILNLGR
ncbi:MAG: hypothetical protein QGI49_02295 [SAR202 cluster bacterium]|nr:hypothetical protein [SAR202 cluster bacterium]